MFHALIVPQVDLKIPDGRVRRRLEAKSLSKAREVQIEGLTLDEFSKLEITEQFLHLRKSIPDGWKPVSFKDDTRTITVPK